MVMPTFKFETFEQYLEGIFYFNHPDGDQEMCMFCGPYYMALSSLDWYEEQDPWGTYYINTVSENLHQILRMKEL